MSSWPELDSFSAETQRLAISSRPGPLDSRLWPNDNAKYSLQDLKLSDIGDGARQTSPDSTTSKDAGSPRTSTPEKNDREQDLFLSSFPDRLPFSQLKSLELSSISGLTELPSNFLALCCGQLQFLSLEGCRLTHLPASVLKSSELTTLRVGKNQLQQFPAGLCDFCVKLAVLRAEDNFLGGDLRELLCGGGGGASDHVITNTLKEVSVARNRLSSLAKDFLGDGGSGEQQPFLPNTTELDLSGNAELFCGIDSFGPVIAQCDKLKKLLLHDCKNIGTDKKLGKLIADSSDGNGKAMKQLLVLYRGGSKTDRKKQKKKLDEESAKADMWSG